MATFIEKSCCKGHRPEGVIGTCHNLRPDITGRLLHERHAARFLVGPVGYGKSSVAYEYAQIVFGFKNTFWLRGSSPCFLRDLDSGDLAKQLFRADPDAKLVVCDDVPHLDESRRILFEEAVNALIDHGCEAIATCTPASDSFIPRFSDKVVLGAYDLLLTDDEIAIEEMKGNASPQRISLVGASCRAACQVWGVDGARTIIKGIQAETLPSELKLVILLILLTSQGGLDELGDIATHAHLSEDLAFLEDGYPFLGISRDAMAFDAMPVSVQTIAECWRHGSKKSVVGSSFKDPDYFFSRVAEKALSKGKRERSYEIMRSFAGKDACANWVASTGWDLLGDAEAFPVASLCRYVGKVSGKASGGVGAVRAWASYVLRERRDAEDDAMRVIRLPPASASWEALGAASILAARSGDSSVAERGLRSLRDLMQAKSLGKGRIKRDGITRSFIDWAALGTLILASHEGRCVLEKAWAQAIEETAHADGGPLRETPIGVIDALLLFAAWHISDVFDRRKAVDGKSSMSTAGESRLDAMPRNQAAGAFADGEEAGESFQQELAPYANFMHKALCGSDAPDIPRWIHLLAAKGLERYIETFPFAAGYSLSPTVMAHARTTDMLILEQVEAYKKLRANEEKAKSEFALTHPDPFRVGAQSLSQRDSLRAATPTLRISLFGGLDVRLGFEDAEPRLLRRTKAKVALAMLAINVGREVSWDRLTAMLWPGKGSDFCKRNFYVVWGYMKKILEVEGYCPYLIRSQAGFKLDSRYVVTDLEVFNELCRNLLFGEGDSIGWEEVYRKVTQDFSEDFLPGINGNDYVDELRKHYRDQLIDGLIQTSGRLAFMNESRGSLWFAREALRRDELREDSYIALIEAQIASNQRGAALETYFACRRALGDRLGIDPSPRIMELYTSIIESEEAF